MYDIRYPQGSGEASSRLSSVLDAAVDFRTSVREIATDRDVPKPQRTRLFQACDSLRDSLSSAGVELKVRYHLSAFKPPAGRFV